MSNLEDIKKLEEWIKEQYKSFKDDTLSRSEYNVIPNKIYIVCNNIYDRISEQFFMQFCVTDTLDPDGSKRKHSKGYTIIHGADHGKELTDDKLNMLAGLLMVASENLCDLIDNLK